jgi:tetratricopeptide (TPR) repeat protein
MEQFDASGSLVNGKRVPLADEPTGNYLLTVSLSQPGWSERPFGTLNFKVFPGAPSPVAWDVTDPDTLADLQKGISDEERGQCHVAQGQPALALVWFRRALEKNRVNEASRENLVDYYFSQKDFLTVVQLYNQDGLTDSTGLETILRVSDSFDKTGDPQKAISVLEAALATRPESGPLFLALSKYYHEVGNDKKAEELAHRGQVYLDQGTGGTN